MDVATERCRCGYELRHPWPRCPSCRRRVRERRTAPPPWSSGRTGPAAAEAWQRRHELAARAGAVPQHLHADLARYRDATPAAAALSAALAAVRLVGLALAGVHGGRLVLALAAGGPGELRASEPWSTLGTAATLAGVVLAAVLAVVGVLTAAWVVAAVPNLAALQLRVHPRRPFRVVLGAGALATAAGLAARHAWAGGVLAAERVGPATWLAVALALAVAAHELRPVVAAVTVQEAAQAEHLARIAAANRD